MANFPDEYGGINALDLLNRILVVYGPEVYREKKNSIKAGPGFTERMEEFYEWCYKNKIVPL